MLARLSFRTKISLAMMAVLLVFGVSVAVVISRTASQALLEESKRRGISGALHLTARIEDPLLAMDYLRMKDVADEVTRTSEDIAYLFILNEGGIPLVHSFQGGFPTDLLLVNSVSGSEPYRIQLLTTGKELIHDFAVPVLIGSNRLGTVRLGVSHERIGAAVDRLLSTILVIVGLAVVLAAILGALVSRTTTRRIEVLRQSAEEIVKGNL
ncbi:MAG: cell wall metabolism sensor histidine kinase WalK, partial [Syntrophobacteraceae bacterium]|nr:cell wall metabolism sensor histidine kinase WalK [Syntrophobacteraceae bacterium]